jgi:peptide deformylase
MAIFVILFGKFFDHMYTYALKIYQKICPKTAYFFGQSEFRKNSIIGLLIVPILSYGEETMHNHILQEGDPVLRGLARSLTVEEIVSAPIQELIEDMKRIMREAPGVGLAAPQIGSSLQIAVIEDSPEFMKFLTPEQIAERDRRVVPFHVIINPKITLIESEGTAEFFEGCLSIPDTRAIVSRAKCVRVDCLNEKGEPIVIEAQGWYARILQHEIDHLNGVLFVDRAYRTSIMSEETYQTNWMGKSIAEIRSCLCPTSEGCFTCDL